MSNAGPLETLARVVGDALTPLADRLEGDGAEQVLEEVGLRLPGGALAQASLTHALGASVGACSHLPDAVAALVNAIDAGNDTAMIAAALKLAERLVQATAAFVDLGNAIDTIVQAAAGLTPAERTRLTQAAAAIPESLLHLAVITYLEEKQPAVKGALELIGLLDDREVPADPADPSAPPHRQQRLRFDRIGPLLSDPLQHLKDLYGFGRADFDGIELFTRIKALVDGPEAEALLIKAPGQPAVLDAFMFRLAVAPAAIPGLRIRFRRKVEKDIDVSVPISGPWKGTVHSTARFEGGIELLLDPRTGLHIEPPIAAATIEAAVGILAQRDDGSPLILIGQAGGSRLELGSFAARLPMSLSASLGAPSPEVDLGAEVELKRGKLIIDTSNSDGFIGTLLSGVHVESAFDLDARYDTKEGLRFVGSATIEIQIPTHLSLGPIDLTSVYLVSGFKDGGIPVEFSVDVDAALGPLSASVSRMGALAQISFPKEGGNAGPAQIDVGFKAPNGVGLGIDAGVVKGGGFLYIDVERGEYDGVLQLSIAEIVTVTAIGLITTKNPDGSSGFSLLVIITAEFGAGIQLGFGFVLLGVGGLLGLNRTAKTEPLTEGVKTGAIDGIMFPHDVIANAARIISDLRSWFPPLPGTFLIGPMAKLGWGTPALVTASFGIIVEIPPGNIIILGVLRVALPTEDEALVKIQVAFIGAIEFDKQRLWFFASIFDSRVVSLTIEGDFGLLIAWGDDPNFVLSLGGFHPAFQPPPLPFPSPRRIAVSLIDCDYARVRIEGYFAVTSNTVQFGAAVEIFFGFDAFNISGHLAFDALFQFSPFHFIISISASFSLTAFGVGLLSVSISGSLAGPAPWEAKGTGSISILFFSISADFDVTWGESDQSTLPPIQVMPLFQAEVEKPANWRAILPAGNGLLVSLRKLPESDALVLHPLGRLRVSQRALPLALTLDKVGNQKPSDVNRLTLAPGAGPLAKADDAVEQFAPAQFQNFSDSEKLSRPAYVSEHAGIELKAASGDFMTSQLVKRIVRYEQIILDTNAVALVTRFFLLAIALFTHFLKGDAVAKSELSQASKTKLSPFAEKVSVGAETYAVVFQSDNKPLSGAPAIFSSEASAREYLSQKVAADPNAADTLHVIPSFEKAA